MKRTSKFIILPFIFVLAILAVFTISQPVHAQDELPPTEPVVEPAPVGSDPAPVEVPPESGVALLTEADAPIALDSTEAAALPADVDPWFKVGTTTYTFTLADCDPGLAVVACPQPLQAAVDYIHAHGTIPSDGFIHVDAGILPDQQVIINGSLAYENNIKGIIGHRDTAGTTPSFLPDAYLTYTAGAGSYISVINKTNGFTLSSLDITGDTTPTSLYGVVDFYGNTGPILLQQLRLADLYDPIGYGIRIVNQNGSVTISSVTVEGYNEGGGAYINNSAGTAGVTITSSAFDNTAGSTSVTYLGNGVHIFTKGAVLLTNVTASFNKGLTYPSMWIDNTAGTAGVTINRGIFNDNDMTGLRILTRGTILLTNIDASGNQNAGSTAWGAELDNHTALTALGVTLTNGTFIDNWTTGLQIHTKGSVLLTNVASWNNDSVPGSYGVDIDNTYGTAGNVTITNLPSTDSAMQPGFNNNHDRGVNIHTNGLVKLTNVNAIGNQEEGIFVFLDGNKGVTLTNCRADGNMTSFGTSGIYINSIGPIVINGGHANDNAGYGLYVHNETASDLAVKTVTISNFIANENYGYGVIVDSKGAIKLTNVVANFTHSIGGNYSGIYLKNTYNAALTPPGITLLKVAANENAYNGIYLQTRGIVSMTTISATGNGHYGAYISQSSTPPAYPVTTITTGNFSGNASWGLTLYGRGTITLKDITADHNTNGNGAYITNASGNVSLLASTTGGNSFSYNLGTHDGLDIDTQGAITVNKVTAIGNTGATGVYLYSGATHPGNVIVNGGTFSYNAQGLIVLSKGTINVSNLIAEHNTNDGINLNNTYDPTGAKGITIAKVDVNMNGTGLHADSYGLITVNRVFASGNSGNGVELVNDYTATIYLNKGVTLTSSYGVSNLSNNAYSGLYIRSRGPISLNGVIADSNAWGAAGDTWGIDLDESGVANGGGKITLTNITTRYNRDTGIHINTVGGFVGSYITANLNGWEWGWNGMSVYPHNSAVSISNSVFMENGYYGFKVIYTGGSLAPLTLTNITATGNGYMNIYIQR